MSDLKKDFLNSIISAGDDVREAKFSELKNKIRSGDTEAQELLDFLISYDEVSVRYFAKKISQDLLSDKSGDLSDSVDVGDILRNLGEGSIPKNDGTKAFKSINTDALARYLNDPDYRRRIKVVQGAGQMGDSAAIPFLINTLADERHPFVKATIVKVLGSFRDSRVIPVIAEYLKDPDHRTRANAIEGMEQIPDPKVVEFLVPLLQDPEHRVRANAAKVLVKFGKKDVMDVLEKMLASPAVWLQESSIYALGEIASDSSFELLTEKFRSSGRDDIRLSAVKALTRLPQNQELKKFFQDAYKDLSDKQSQLGILLSHAIGKGGEKASFKGKSAKTIWVSLAAAAAFAGISAGYWFFNRDSSDTEQLTQVARKKIESQEQISVKPAEKTPPVSETQALIDSGNDVKDDSIETADNILEDLIAEKPDEPAVEPVKIIKEEKKKPADKKVKTSVEPTADVSSLIPETNTESVKDSSSAKSDIQPSDIIKANTDGLDELFNKSSGNLISSNESMTPSAGSDKTNIALSDSGSSSVSNDFVLNSSSTSLNQTEAKPVDTKSVGKIDSSPETVSSVSQNMEQVIDWARTQITRENMDIAVKSSSRKVLSLDEKLESFGIVQKVREKILAATEEEKKNLNKKLLIVYLQTPSGTNEDRVYSKGFTDFLISSFSKIPGLDVISRENMHSKLNDLSLGIRDLERAEIVQRLGEIFAVDYVIFGSVKESGNSFGQFYKTYIDAQPEKNEAIDNYLEGNLNQDIYSDSALANLTQEEKDEIIARNYQTGKQYLERQKYYEAYQSFRITQTVLQDSSTPYQELNDYMRVAQQNLSKTVSRENDRLKKSIVLNHSLKILDVTKRKVIWERTFYKELYYFRDILQKSFEEIFNSLKLSFSGLTPSFLFSGFTSDLEAFLGLYRAIDYLDYDLGDRTLENVEDTVLDMYQKCLLKDAEYSDAYYYRSLLYARKNNADMALMDANRASQLDPVNVRVLYQIVFYRKKLGDNNGAQLELEKISKLKNLQYTSIISRAHLDLAYRQFRQGNDPKGMSELQSALVIDPSDPETYLALGIYYKARSNYLLAFYALEEADRLSPDTVYIKIMIADVLNKMEDHDSMIGHLKKALLVVNTDRRYMTSGKYRLEKFDDAPTYSASALYYFLGVAFKAKGSGELSRSYFRQCITLDPHSDFAFESRKELRL